MSFEVVTGPAGLNAWDQNHAEAMRRLRHADAFIVFTWDDLENASAQLAMLAKEGGVPVICAMLAVAVRALTEAAGEVAEWSAGA
jgi:hypothetical protein